MTADRPSGATVRGRRRSRRGLILALLAGAFVLRLGFGLVENFWGEDERQIYLIGLQYYTTGAWPNFGPDVVYTQTRVPGGLQGLLIAAPLWLWAQPEAPYVLLNLLSFGALVLLGWYIGRRLPNLPRWALWPWLFFSPWTLDLSTHIYNPSYVLSGAVLFFVGACELVPALSLGVLPRPLAAFFMGFALLWVAQLHLSAPLLAAIALLVFALAVRDDARAAIRGLLWGGLGVALAGLTLIPTFIHAGAADVLRTGANVSFQPRNLLRAPQLAAQYLSFGSFEIARFIGSSTAERWAFLVRYPWAAPFVVCAAVGGVVQTIALFAGLFWKRAGASDWPAVRGGAALILALLYASFLWSIRSPTSHTFYVVAPAVIIYAFYCWDRLLRRRAVRIAAGALLVCGFVTHAALAARNFTDRSLYVNRPLVERAIAEKNYRLVGERRTEGWTAPQ